MTCRRSDGLERSWYDPWYDSLYYDPDLACGGRFLSNIVNMSYLYYFRDRSEWNRARGTNNLGAARHVRRVLRVEGKDVEPQW